VTAEDTTPAHAANCRALLEKSGGVYNVGPFTPFLYHEEGTPPRTSLIFPGATGGTNWGGMATDQQRGYVFVYTQNQGQIGWVEKKKPGVNYAFDEAQSNLPYTRASVNGPGPFFTFSRRRAKGSATTRASVHRGGSSTPSTRTPAKCSGRRRSASPSVCPRASRTPGWPGGFAGPTATAGGLVFYAALSDRQLRAFESTTGKELWSVDLGRHRDDAAMSYLGSDRRQYIAVVAGGTVKTFALPR
jgi:quinoprotein glucose dehydrogenase